VAGLHAGIIKARRPGTPPSAQHAASVPVLLPHYEIEKHHLKSCRPRATLRAGPF
jgi:hypothetical protein